MSSEERAALPAGTTVYECPIAACEWTFAQSAPDVTAPGPVVPGATLEESVSLASLAIMREWLAAAEPVIEVHLKAHTLLEWVTEIMRLRRATAGTVAVSREDLERVHEYARHFDVDEDPAMVHVAAILKG
ncbi:MAG TPA: hypothetical protein VFY14_17445 [Streptomyces sp.]|nr:hypothetical protein [Streptomyces sp.]